jgi:urease accessory protein UreF
MDRVETMIRLKEIDAEIKALKDEKEILRTHAIVQGWATMQVIVRWNAPSLAWWKEQHPRSWEKHCIQNTYERFTPEKV